jgi:erythromycin esterase-like protein
MADDGMINIGHLTREKYGEYEVVLVGFGTNRGTVIAGETWDAPWQEMRVPPAREDTWEDVLHRAMPKDGLIVFPTDVSVEMSSWRGHRAIGVVYRPQYERYGNYVPTILPRRYDAFLYVDQTQGVRPLFRPTEAETPEEAPETFPTGV